MNLVVLLRDLSPRGVTLKSHMVAMDGIRIMFLVTVPTFVVGLILTLLGLIAGFRRRRRVYATQEEAAMRLKESRLVVLGGVLMVMNSPLLVGLWFLSVGR